jgi:hypothetical protein
VEKIRHDVERRYRPTDWVSEYQRLWAIFNYWLTNATKKGIPENQKIKIFKDQISDELDKWTSNLTRYARPTEVKQYSFLEIYSRFESRSLISDFFMAIEDLPASLKADTHFESVRKTKKYIVPLQLSSDALQVTHKIYSNLLSSEFGILYNVTFHDALNALKIEMTGPFLYRTAPTLKIQKEHAEFAAKLVDEFRKNEALQPLIDLIEANDKDVKSLSSEIIDRLYCLRCMAVHGDLDFLEETHNHVARTAFDLLESLIRAFIRGWK